MDNLEKSMERRGDAGRQQTPKSLEYVAETSYHIPVDVIAATKKDYDLTAAEQRTYDHRHGHKMNAVYKIDAGTKDASGADLQPGYYVVATETTLPTTAYKAHLAFKLDTRTGVGPTLRRALKRLREE